MGWVAGPSALAGLGVMIVLVPINVIIANKVKSLQVKQMAYKDERVKLMNEVLSGIKVRNREQFRHSFIQVVLSKIRTFTKASDTR